MSPFHKLQKEFAQELIQVLTFLFYRQITQKMSFNFQD